MPPAPLPIPLPNCLDATMLGCVTKLLPAVLCWLCCLPAVLPHMPIRAIMQLPSPAPPTQTLRLLIRPPHLAAYLTPQCLTFGHTGQATEEYQGAALLPSFCAITSSRAHV
jgi:hypothetical protein